MDSEYVLRPRQSTAVEERTAAGAWKWEPWLRRCVTTFIVVMIGYAVIGLWAVHSDLAAAARGFPPATVGSVIGLVVVGVALRALRWHYYVRHLHWRLPLSHSIVAFLAGLTFTATPGKAGEAIKIVLLRMRHDVPLAAGAGVLVVERLGDLIAVVLLSFAGLTLVTGAGMYLTFAVIFVAAVTICIGNRSLHEPLLARLARIKRLSGLTNRIAQALDACRQLLRPAPFLAGIGLALVAWSCEAAAFYQLASSVGIRIEPLQACSIFAVATLAGVLSALPGGIGGFEAVMVLLLTRLGVGVAAATPAVVVFRLCTLWFGILLGVMFLLAWILFIGRPGPSIAAPSRSP